MKIVQYIFAVFYILISGLFPTFAQQIPQSFSYQAIAKSDEGIPIADKQILVEISIIKGSENGSIAYREIQQPITDSYGLFGLNIGEGTPTFDGATTNFSLLVWTDDAYFLKIRIDFNQGTPLNGLVDMGTVKLQSVPYALAAKNAVFADRLSNPVQLKLTELNDVGINTPNDQDVIRWNTALSKWEAAPANGTAGEFLRADGSSDLTGDWTISSHNIQLTSGNFTLANGILTTDTLRFSAGQKIAAVSTDGSLTLNSDFEIPTVKAVKTYVDSNTGTGVWQSDPDYLYYNGTKNVGIGTNTPIQKFHVHLNSQQNILFEGPFGGETADLGAGTRMTFSASKSAFRAGTIQTQADWWNNSNIGTYSTAFGLDNKASGSYSLAGGLGNQATGAYSMVWGRNNIAGNAGATAFGFANSAGGLYSLTSGQNNTSLGNSSNAFGFYTVTNTYLETAFGRYNKSLGSSSSGWTETESIFEIGNGTSESTRSNAVLVLKNGNTGIGLGTNAPQSLFEVGIAGDGSYARANAWNTFSDERLKTKITKIENAILILDSLNGYYYFWKNDADKSRQIGVIAQEVEKVLPEIVKQDTKGNKSVDYAKLTAVLIEAVKEQQTEIKYLTNQNKELTEKNCSFEARLEDIEKYIKAAANLNMNK